MDVGKYMQLSCDHAFPDVEFTYSEPDIVRVDGLGRVYGLKAGTVKVTASFGGASSSIDLEIQDKGVYDVRIDSQYPVDGGDFIGFNGDEFHFNEDGVYENKDGYPFIIGPTGSLTLSTAIRGITDFTVECEEESYYLRSGYHPGQYDNFNKVASGTPIADLGQAGGLQIVNNSAADLHIKSISFHYTRSTEIDTIVNQTKAHASEDVYDGNRHVVSPDKYEIPDIVDGVKYKAEYIQTSDPTPLQATAEPGHYVPGSYIHGVRIVDAEGRHIFTARSFQNIKMPDGKHAAIFHMPDDSCKVYAIDDGQDVTEFPALEDGGFWSNGMNQFTALHEDRHYYPSYTIFCTPGDEGGNPTSFTYSTITGGLKIGNGTVKPGYQFVGWYLDREFTKPFDERVGYSGVVQLYSKTVKTDSQIYRIRYYDADDNLESFAYVLAGQGHSLKELPNLPEKMGTWEISCPSSATTLHNPHDFLEFGNPESKTAYADDIEARPFRYHTADEDVFMYRVNAAKKLTMVMEASDFKEGQSAHLASYIKTKSANGDAGSMSAVDKSVPYLFPYASGVVHESSSYTQIVNHMFASRRMNYSEPLEGIEGFYSVETVGKRAFQYRYGLGEGRSYFPVNAKTFDEEAYADVHFNRVITLPRTLTSIGANCFSNATGVEEIFIPKTLVSVAENSFNFANSPKLKFHFEGSEDDWNKLIPSATRKAILGGEGTSAKHTVDFNNNYRFIH